MDMDDTTGNTVSQGPQKKQKMNESPSNKAHNTSNNDPDTKKTEPNTEQMTKAKMSTSSSKISVRPKVYSVGDDVVVLHRGSWVPGRVEEILGTPQMYKVQISYNCPMLHVEKKDLRTRTPFAITFFNTRCSNLENMLQKHGGSLPLDWVASSYKELFGHSLECGSFRDLEDYLRSNFSHLLRIYPPFGGKKTKTVVLKSTKTKPLFRDLDFISAHSELTSEAIIALSLIFSEHSVMDISLLQTYRHKLTTRNPKTKEIMKRHGGNHSSRGKNNGDKKHLHLKGFLEWYRLSALSKPMEVWQDLQSFGFKNDLLRSSMNCYSVHEPLLCSNCLKAQDNASNNVEDQENLKEEKTEEEKRAEREKRKAEEEHQKLHEERKRLDQRRQEKNMLQRLKTLQQLERNRQKISGILKGENSEKGQGGSNSKEGIQETFAAQLHCMQQCELWYVSSSHTLCDHCNVKVPKMMDIGACHSCGYMYCILCMMKATEGQRTQTSYNDQVACLKNHMEEHDQIQNRSALCDLCSRKILIGLRSVFCRKCSYLFCDNCFHDPPEVKTTSEVVTESSMAEPELERRAEYLKERDTQEGRAKYLKEQDTLEAKAKFYNSFVKASTAYSTVQVNSDDAAASSGNTAPGTNYLWAGDGISIPSPVSMADPQLRVETLRLTQKPVTIRATEESELSMLPCTACTIQPHEQLVSVTTRCNWAGDLIEGDLMLVLMSRSGDLKGKHELLSLKGPASGGVLTLDQSVPRFKAWCILSSQEPGDIVNVGYKVRNLTQEKTFKIMDLKLFILFSKQQKPEDASDVSSIKDKKDLIQSLKRKREAVKQKKESDEVEKLLDGDFPQFSNDGNFMAIAKKKMEEMKRREAEEKQGQKNNDGAPPPKALHSAEKSSVEQQSTPTDLLSEWRHRQNELMNSVQASKNELKNTVQASEAKEVLQGNPPPPPEDPTQIKRKLFVGNLPVRHRFTVEEFKEFFGAAMKRVGFTLGEGNPIQWIKRHGNKRKGYSNALVGLRSEKETSMMLNLHGIGFKGKKISIRRPPNYPGKSALPRLNWTQTLSLHLSGKLKSMVNHDIDKGALLKAKEENKSQIEEAVAIGFSKALAEEKQKNASSTALETKMQESKATSKVPLGTWQTVAPVTNAPAVPLMPVPSMYPVPVVPAPMMPMPGAPPPPMGAPPFMPLMQPPPPTGAPPPPPGALLYGGMPLVQPLPPGAPPPPPVGPPPKAMGDANSLSLIQIANFFQLQQSGALPKFGKAFETKMNKMLNLAQFGKLDHSTVQDVIRDLQKKATRGHPLVIDQMIQFQLIAKRLFEKQMAIEKQQMEENQLKQKEKLEQQQQQRLREKEKELEEIERRLLEQQKKQEEAAEQKRLQEEKEQREKVQKKMLAFDEKIKAETQKILEKQQRAKDKKKYEQQKRMEEQNRLEEEQMQRDKLWLEQQRSLQQRLAEQQKRDQGTSSTSSGMSNLQQDMDIDIQPPWKRGRLTTDSTLHSAKDSDPNARMQELQALYAQQPDLSYQQHSLQVKAPKKKVSQLQRNQLAQIQNVLQKSAKGTSRKDHQPSRDITFSLQQPMDPDLTSPPSSSGMPKSGGPTDLRSKALYLYNLPLTLDDDELLAILTGHGKCLDVRVLPDNEARGAANVVYVAFSSVAAACNCKKALEAQPPPAAPEVVADFWSGTPPSDPDMRLVLPSKSDSFKAAISPRSNISSTRQGAWPESSYLSLNSSQQPTNQRMESLFQRWSMSQVQHMQAEAQTQSQALQETASEDTSGHRHVRYREWEVYGISDQSTPANSQMPQQVTSHSVAVQKPSTKRKKATLYRFD